MKFEALIKSHPLVLVDYYANWCGPCKALAPTLEQLKKEFGDKVKVIKIDTEKNHRLATAKGIKSIPALHFYKYGKLQWKQTGALPLNTLKEKIKPFV